MKKIVFVCTGNTCRSPMAQYIANNVFAKVGVQASSAGLFAIEGCKISDNSVAALAEIGIDASLHKAAVFSAKILEDADLVVAVSLRHKHFIINNYANDEAQRSKVVYFGDLTQVGEIEDPFGCDLETYREVRDRIESAMPFIARYLEI